MPSNNLLVSIRMAYNDLTKLEKKVADYVLDYPQDVMKMTLSDLAAHCGVGDTTVFRFCRSMDLAGYQDFKLSLALSTHVSEVLDSRENVSLTESGSLHELAGQVSAIMTDTIAESLATLDYEALERTVDALMGAGSIYLYGFGNSGVAALLLQNRLMRIRYYPPFIRFCPMALDSLIQGFRHPPIYQFSGICRVFHDVDDRPSMPDGMLIFLRMPDTQFNLTLCRRNGTHIIKPPADLAM